MKEEIQLSNTTERTKNIEQAQLASLNLDLKSSGMSSRCASKSSVKQEHSCNKNDSKLSHPSSFSWPSLWKNGPRRSAFQPYKPPSCSSSETVVKVTVDLETGSANPTEPRPASATALTNLQRGNIQAEAAPCSNTLSWFTLAGRGDITTDQLYQMIAQGKDIDCVDEDGLSGMMWAAFHGQIHTVQLLLELKVEVDKQSMWGETALMLAATEGHVEIVRLLINAGANVNHEDHCQSTALMCAVYGDHPHTVSELLMNGADLWVHNNNGFTAYDIAVDHKSYRSKAVLEKYISSLITGS